MKNHFPKEERECHCGCGTDSPSPVLLERLNNAREDIGRAIYVTSMCRCPEYNSRDTTGGSPTSSHITTQEKMGEAADIVCQDHSYRFILIRALLKAGFRRILIYPMFIHVDVDLNKAQDILVYMEMNRPKHSGIPNGGSA